LRLFEELLRCGVRQVIVVSPDRYLFVPVVWTRGPAPEVEPTVFARGTRDPAVDAALVPRPGPDLTD
jgi:hypothetical protein